MQLRLQLVALLVGLAACGPSSDATHRMQITDDLDRTVYVPREIQRVASLAPSVTEIVFAAGAGQKLVGVTDADDYPTAVHALPTFSALPIDFEAVLALDPDLVLASDQINSPRDAATFAATGIPTFFLSVDGVEGMFRAIDRMASLLGTHSAVTDSLRASLRQLRLVTESASERPLTLFLISDETLYSFGRGSYIHEVIELAGGQSITSEFDSRAPVLSDEFVLVEKPEVIVGSFGQTYDPNRLVQLHPTWDIVPAVMDGRVFSVDGDLFLRPGPRLVTGAWQLAKLLHPDLIP